MNTSAVGKTFSMRTKIQHLKERNFDKKEVSLLKKKNVEMIIFAISKKQQNVETFSFNASVSTFLRQFHLCSALGWYSLFTKHS